MADLEKHQREVARLYELWQDAKSKLDRALKENAILKMGQSDQSQYATRLQQSFKSKLDEMKDKLQYADIKVQKITAENEKLRHALNEHKKRASAMEESFAAAKERMQEVLNDARAQQTSQVEAFRRFQHEKENEREGMDRKLKHEERRRQEVERVVTEVSNRMREREEDVRHLRSLVEEKDKKLKKMTESASNAERLAQSATEEVEHLQRRVEDLEGGTEAGMADMKRKVDELNFDLSLAVSDKRRLAELLQQVAFNPERGVEAAEEVLRPGSASYIRSARPLDWLEARQSDESRHWLPSPILHVLKTFRTSHCPSVSLSSFRELVSDIYQLSKQYEVERMNVVKQRYADAVKDYKRKIAQQKSYEQVRMEDELQRRRKQVASLQRQLMKAEGPSLRTSKKGKRVFKKEKKIGGGTDGVIESDVGGGRSRGRGRSNSNEYLAATSPGHRRVSSTASADNEDVSLQIAAGAAWFGKKALEWLEGHKQIVMSEAERFESLSSTIMLSSPTGRVNEDVKAVSDRGMKSMTRVVESVADTIAAMAHLVKTSEETMEDGKTGGGTPRRAYGDDDANGKGYLSEDFSVEDNLGRKDDGGIADVLSVLSDRDEYNYASKKLDQERASSAVGRFASTLPLSPTRSASPGGSTAGSGSGGKGWGGMGGVSMRKGILARPSSASGQDALRVFNEASMSDGEALPSMQASRFRRFSLPHQQLGEERRRSLSGSSAAALRLERSWTASPKGERERGKNIFA